MPVDILHNKDSPVPLSEDTIKTKIDWNCTEENNEVIIYSVSSLSPPSPTNTAFNNESATCYQTEDWPASLECDLWHQAVCSGEAKVCGGLSKSPFFHLNGKACFEGAIFLNKWPLTAISSPFHCPAAERDTKAGGKRKCRRTENVRTEQRL